MSNRYKIYDEENNLLREANCIYDACDLVQMIYNAEEVKLNFTNKEMYIISRYKYEHKNTRST